MMIAVNAITAVAIQPIHRRPSWMGNFPMILGLPVICIMATMIGTATIPLMTALQ